MQIYVRNKRPEGVQTFKSDRIAILMHGATYPGTAFDLPLGRQVLDGLHGGAGASTSTPSTCRATDARRGRRSWMRPPTRTRPSCAPPTRPRRWGRWSTSCASGAGVDKVNLIGWSWGTTITAAYTADNQGKVERLALYAPVWLRTTPSLVQVQGKLGAYRVVSRDQALGRWLTGVPEDKKAALIPAGWFDAWADATFATDPKGEGKTLRAPNGVVQDGLDYWGATPPKAYWDPAKITSPVLLVLGEWDRDTPTYMAQTLYPLLTDAAWKRHVVLSEGTHTILMEKNRMLLLRTVQQFLEEPPPTATATQ